MKQVVPIAFLSTLWFAACGGETPHTHGPGDGHDRPARTGSEPDHEHGPTEPLGDIKLGEYTAQVAQEGKVEPGKEVGVDVTFAKGTALPTLRAWVGIESAVGSMKAKLGKEGDAMLHGHVEVPKPLPAGSALWFEADLPGGAKKASIAFRQ
jgi:hypothetical protein